jgi:hypothetical protein
VEAAIIIFERLVTAYVGAIERLQSRTDIIDVATEDLQLTMTQMDEIVTDWSKIQATLQQVKTQVEMAMEWEELWTVVFGDIQDEKDELVRLVFEMEERRHKSILAAVSLDDTEAEVNNIELRNHPPGQKSSTDYSSLCSHELAQSPIGTPSPLTSIMDQEDISLLALFARMQPLRASLDFLPIRLSLFMTRARDIFPSACNELDERRLALINDYERLERDAEALRKELSEDRWILVFRGAGRQAQKMCESVERAVTKLKDALATTHGASRTVLAKKIDCYEAKKTHYVPAIDRIIAMIDRGVQDRLTVNGEILRLHLEVRGGWDRLREHIQETDAMLEQSVSSVGYLDDSCSSVLSTNRSIIADGCTLHSPPSCNVVTPSALHRPVTPIYPGNHNILNGHSKRRSLLLPLNSKLQRQKHAPPRDGKASHEKPWNLYITNPSKIATNYNNFLPTSPSTLPASSAASTPSTSRSPGIQGISTIGSRSTSNTEFTLSKPSGTSPGLSIRERFATAGHQTKQMLHSTHVIPRRASSAYPGHHKEGESTQPERPASSLATGRDGRQSFLPKPVSSTPLRSASAIGRSSPVSLGPRKPVQQSIGSSSSTRDVAFRPRWRP